VPADRPDAGCLPDRRDGQCDALALRRLVERVMAFLAPAMRPLLPARYWLMTKLLPWRAPMIVLPCRRPIRTVDPRVARVLNQAIDRPLLDLQRRCFHHVKPNSFTRRVSFSILRRAMGA
jgi:hypothetical protein